MKILNFIAIAFILFSCNNQPTPTQKKETPQAFENYKNPSPKYTNPNKQEWIGTYKAIKFLGQPVPDSISTIVFYNDNTWRAGFGLYGTYKLSRTRHFELNIQSYKTHQRQIGKRVLEGVWTRQNKTLKLTPYNNNPISIFIKTD